MIDKCLQCGHTEFYVAETLPGYQALLLPGAGVGTWKISSRFKVCVCDRCGYVHFFVPPQHMDKVRKSKKFKKINTKSL